MRRICPDCREKVKLSRAERELFAKQGLSEATAYKGRGCKACHNSGFRGRTGLYEIFESGPEIEEMIVAGRRDSEVRSYLASKGMRSILKDGFAKVVSGVTTLSEVERAIAG